MLNRPQTGGLAREHIREVNTKALLEALHNAGQSSRTDLALQLGLSQAAVTEITAELLRGGIVFEARAARTKSVGRKPILLQIDYNAATVMGVKVSNRAVTSALTNLQTDITATHVEPLTAHSPEAVLQAIDNAVDKLAAKAPAPLVATAVTLPGIIDAGRDRIDSPMLGWHDTAFGGALQERLGIPVLLDNDVNALAAAEASFGHGRDHRSFLVVTLGRGVGLGIVINGQVYRGERGGAGEFGHVSISEDGPVCNCGKRGCLEAYLADDRLLDQLRERRPHLSTLEEATSLAEAGDSQAAAVFSSAGQVLGRGLAMLTNIFAPSLILLAGEGMRSAQLLLPGVQESLQEHAFGQLDKNVELIIEDWGDDAWARGAAGLAAAHYLDNIAVEIGATVKERRASLQAPGR